MIVWNEYLKYRAELRGFDLRHMEETIRSSTERYKDTVTGSTVVVGHHAKALVMIPCETDGSTITPLTIEASHAASCGESSTVRNFYLFEARSLIHAASCGECARCSVHVTTRQQINSRIRSGRLTNASP